MQHALCLIIDIRHHHMKRIGALLSNVVERVDVALVNIKVGIRREI
jgi:hypothetical protein